MSSDTKIRNRRVRWLDLVVPRRSLERRVRRSAHLDALRGVRSTEPGGSPYPATIGEIAAWEASTVRALGGHVRKLAGEHDARIDGLQARIVALGPPPEQRLAVAVPEAHAESASPVSASHPEAQARRRARLNAQAWAAADGERVALQAELAEETALRASVVDAAREAGRQCHESSLALQHLYWAVRTRWARRKHGTSPAPAYADVPLPEWVAAPELLYGGRRPGGPTA